MPTCAEVLARTLRDAGVTRMFGLPGGEILDFIDAARRCGIEFLLTRHEATASLMADVTGQIQRRPGVCVSTLGPGAVNMTLGVANAYLDRSPLIAITATMARDAAPYATHQNLDLNAVYRPLTKETITLDGEDTAAKVRHAVRLTVTPRMGPVHIALPSDVARTADRDCGRIPAMDLTPPLAGAATREAVERVAAYISAARRPILILGLDLNPRTDVAAVRTLVDRFDVPSFVTPKAKGVLSEDHPRYCGVCAGVAGDPLIVAFLEQSDLLIGVGFEPVESDKLWHRTLKLVSIGPVSIASGAYRPEAEAVGDVTSTIAALLERRVGPFDWRGEEIDRYRQDLARVLRPASAPRGLSGYALTRRLRAMFPRDTILTTDVGSIKLITSQAWSSYEPLTFFESNGLSSMSYAFPAAMAARLQFPDRPVLCTIGDGGFSMTFADLETCVRERLHFITVVYNDSALSLIDVAQQKRGQPTYGVRYGSVDFAAASAGLGAWARRVDTLEALDAAIGEGRQIDRPVVIDAIVDPAEYLAHISPLPEGPRARS
ncbi:MAG: thiamine pyrophosphate-binding protein [Acidobacteria bacterium]|nr:thiamine pyrophosphate-binding protein [Acidobacteriota bacterium]